MASATSTSTPLIAGSLAWSLRDSSLWTVSGTDHREPVLLDERHRSRRSLVDVLFR
jgi:hypothetical protein